MLIRSQYIDRYKILKSQMSLFGHDHHIAYTRTNKYGTVSQIKQKGTIPVHEQGTLDFSAPPEPPKLVLKTGTDMDALISNGDAIFRHITQFDMDVWRKEHKRLSEENKKWLKQHYIVYDKHNTEYKTARDRIKQENPEMEKIWEHPELKLIQDKRSKDKEMLTIGDNLTRLGEAKRKHLKTFEDIRKKVIAHFSQWTDKTECEKRADRICYRDVPKKQQKALAEFMGITGHNNLSSLQSMESVKDKRYRANANQATGAITLSEKSSTDTVWHEAAHHLEFSHRWAKRAATHFRYSKAKKDANGNPVTEKLKKIKKGSNYEEHEVAMIDSYVDPYVGKVYIDGSTEVISMGMQALATQGQFSAMLKKDPAHMHLMIGILHQIHGNRSF